MSGEPQERIRRCSVKGEPVSSKPEECGISNVSRLSSACVQELGEGDQTQLYRATAKRRRPRVLVVEDEPDAQLLLKFILEPKYEVVTAGCGAELRRVLDANPDPVSLVLMDLKLDGQEDGVALTKHLRADARWKGIPIVALTACATTEDLRQALEAGCDDYVPKPFYRKQLLALVEGLID
jgi:CheY-like chemotaxis protein